MQEEFNKKQYSVTCIVSFAITIEILLLIIMDMLNLIKITTEGFAMILNICIVAFVIGIIGIIIHKKEKTKGIWLGIIGTILSIGLFFFAIGNETILRFEIFIAIVLLIAVFLKKIISRKI